MSHDDNRDFIVSEITKTGCLNGRYENITCVNWPLNPGEDKRGYFSLVFKAYDNSKGKHVAIKVLDPSHLGDVYRVDCFKREPLIINRLRGKKRCLQLVEELNYHTIKVVVQGGSTIDFPCGFFVTDWIDYDIDDYFLNKDNFAAKVKLIVFRHIVSAVEAIHNSNTFHRDLKPDNMRTDSHDVNNRVILVIDFGTAAQYDSGKLLKEYAYQVGANLYSAPETFLGFAGERKIAKYTDIYALGCMLYELFNDSLFFQELVNNPNYHMVMTALGMTLSSSSSMEDKIKIYQNALNNYSKILEPPILTGTSNTLPNAITGIIVSLYKELVNFNYNNRLSDLALIRSKINTAIKILDNEAYQKRLIERKRLFKINLIEKTLRKNAKLSTYLGGTKRIPC